MSYIQELWNQIPEDQIAELNKLKEICSGSNIDFAVLDTQGNLIKCDLATSIIWQQLYPNANKIASDEINNKKISTLFLNFDHGFGENIFFESMILTDDKPDTENIIRAKTLEEANKNHKFLCNNIRFELIKN
jgi:hypothetical protein